MKNEAAVAILASEGLAQVAVSCQHARSSEDGPHCVFACYGLRVRGVETHLHGRMRWGQTLLFPPFDSFDKNCCRYMST